MRKIAFLFLVYDEINHEELWYKFFRKIDSSRYSIYIHYKYDKPLSYFEPFKLKKPIPTEYAELSLVKAQNLLLQEALRDSENERFVFLSNSCIPLKPFDFVYEDLLRRNVCYFNLARNHHIFERGRGLKLEKRFGKANVRKSSQWSILTREIAQILSESNHELEGLFETGKKDLADEYFYISYLFYLGKQQHLHFYDYAVSDAKTFEYWSDKDYKYNKEFTTDHPENWDRKLKTFYNISADELLFLLNAPCHFGRKFSNNCTVNEKELISDRIASHYNL